MIRMRTAVAIPLVALTLAACTGHGRAVDAEALVPREPGNLRGTSWTLIGTGQTHAVPPTTHTFVVFARLVSSPAKLECRSHRLAFTDAGDANRSGALGWSTVLCSAGHPPAGRYTRALAVVDTATLESGSLVLTGPHSIRMVFNPRNHAAHDVIDEL